ncbi:hypothetical protein [Shigella phage ESh6]|nr:hypothetical protein [Shigella phage ESh6]
MFSLWWLEINTTHYRENNTTTGGFSYDDYKTY